MRHSNTPITADPQSNVSFMSNVSRQAHIQLQHLRVIRCPQSSDRIPTFDGAEATRQASRVCSIGDVVQNLWILVQRRIHEAHGLLASPESLLVDSVHDGGEDRSRCTSAAAEHKLAGVVDSRVVSIGGDLCSRTGKLKRRLRLQVSLTSGIPRPMRLYTPLFSNAGI